MQPEILEPNLEEIKNIKMLKSNKALGEDNMNAELIKIETPELMSKILRILRIIGKTLIICPIYKKRRLNGH